MGKGLLSPVLPLLLVLSLSSPLYAEEELPVDMDDLFSAEMQEATGDPEPPKVDVAALAKDKTRVSGRVSAGLGMGAGLSEWPGTDAAAGRSFADLMEFSGLYYTRASLTVDARPESSLRFFATVETALDEESIDFSLPEVKELFVDYTLKETLFFRLGKQKITWGQGRLLGNPANLVSRVSEGVAVRTTLPAGQGTLNGVVYITPAWKDNPYRNIDPRAFAYAGQWETSTGPAAFSLSGHLKMQDPLHEDIGTSASISFPLGPFDLVTDLVGYWDRENPSWIPAQWLLTAGGFWESPGRSWTILAEYQFDSEPAHLRGHYTALALKGPRLSGKGWRPGLSWKHAFQDHSGEILAGISGPLAPELTLTIGLPLIYGAPGSFYREALAGNVGEEDTLIPVDNVVSLLLSLGLTFTF